MCQVNCIYPKITPPDSEVYKRRLFVNATEADSVNFYTTTVQLKFYNILNCLYIQVIIVRAAV